MGSSGCPEDLQIMQQFGFHCGVGAHRQREPTLWPGQPSGTLDKLTSQIAQLFELPQRCTLFSRVK